MQPKTVSISLVKERHPSVGRNRIYEAIASGDLPAVKVGKQFAIDVELLDAWVASGCPINGQGAA